MKKVAIALLVCSAAAFAEENYGVPTQFRIITPEEIQVHVALHGYAGSYEDAEYKGVILEPVLIKCLNGAPGYYYIFAHEGLNDSNRKAMEGIILFLNDEEGFLWEDISPLINVVRNNSKEYTTFTYNAWDFGASRSKCTGIDSLIYEFDNYVDILNKHFGFKGKPRLKLYAGSPFRSRIIFSAKDNDGERYLWPERYSGWVLDENRRVKSYVGFEEPTREEITDYYYEKIGQLRSFMVEKNDIIESNISEWKETQEKIGAIQREDGYYHILITEYEP